MSVTFLFLVIKTLKQQQFSDLQNQINHSISVDSYLGRSISLAMCFFYLVFWLHWYHDGRNLFLFSFINIALVQYRFI